MISAHSQPAAANTTARAFWREALRGLEQAEPVGWANRAALSTHNPPSYQLVSAESPGHGKAQTEDGALGALGLLLHRYHGERDICLAVAHFTQEPGPIQTIPWRLPAIDSQTSGHWLASISHQREAMRPHVAFDLHAPGDWPLFHFEAAIAFVSDSDFTTSQETQWTSFLQRVGASVGLVVPADPAGRVKLYYSPDRLAATEARRLLSHWHQLGHGLEGPVQPLRCIPLLTDAETDLIWNEWNATDALYPAGECIQQLFEEQVAKTPNAAAVWLEGESIRYGELNERANQLAHHLRTLGVGPDSPVAISLTRSFEMIVAVLAVLKAGGAYVPIDPAYPKERREIMLEDSRAGWILARQGSTSPSLNARLVAMDAPVSEWADAPITNLEPTTSPENLAYVIYTSGSTGRPKGVAMPHRPLVNLLHWQAGSSSILPPSARTLQFASLSFDVSFQEIFSTLTSGGTLLLLREENRHDFDALWKLLCRETVHRIFLPFVALDRLAETSLKFPDETPVALREIITAGEQLQCTPALRALGQRLPGCRIQNQYGPSETHVVSSYTLEGPPEKWPALPPIGRPIANTRLYVLDAERRLLPPGMPGELHIGGVALAQGYLHRPDATAARFITWPEDPGGRLYKTGDLCRFQPDGNLEFLERIDHQVKIRGFRVELGEVETALAEHPQVRQCVVNATRHESINRLVAYVVPRRRDATLGNTLRKFLISRLPDYMVPSAFVLIDALPLTPSGKVDRKALPAPTDIKEAIRTQPYVRPWTTLQCQLAAIWEDLLEVKPIGIHDNFFELGGHSLLAARMVDRLESVCGRKIPLSLLLDKNTIEDISEAVVSTAAVEGPDGLTRLRDGETLPFIFAHGDFNGRGFYCLNLLKHFSPTQPFYTIGPRPATTPLESIGAMARGHLQALRQELPNGPYLLGGFCIGALVAFEMARQLDAAGEKVELILVNPAPANWRMRLFRRATAAYARLRGIRREERIHLFHHWWNRLMRLKEVAQANRPAQLAFLKHKLLGGSPVQERVPEAGHTQFVDSPEDVDTMDAHLWAMAGYRLRPFRGGIQIFLSTEPSLERTDTKKEWGPVTRHLGVETVPGDHLTCLTVKGADLGAKMAQAIQQAAVRLGA